MVTAALILGVLLCLFQAFGCFASAVDTDDKFKQGIGCALVPFFLGLAAFIGAAFFWLY